LGYRSKRDEQKDKVGEPFHYPDTFLLLLLGYAKVCFHLPYRQTESIAQGDMLKENTIYTRFYNNK